MAVATMSSGAAPVAGEPSPAFIEQDVAPVAPSGAVGPGGSVNLPAASAAFGHYADAPTHSEQPKISLGGAAPAGGPNQSIAPPVVPEQNMSESVPPSRPPNKPAVCDRDVSCAPFPEPSLAERAKLGVGKVWSGVQSLFGPKQEEPIYGPPLGQGVNPDGTYSDRMQDGSPLPPVVTPNAAIGPRG